MRESGGMSVYIRKSRIMFYFWFFLIKILDHYPFCPKRIVDGTVYILKKLTGTAQAQGCCNYEIYVKEDDFTGEEFCFPCNVGDCSHDIAYRGWSCPYTPKPEATSNYACNDGLKCIGGNGNNINARRLNNCRNLIDGKVWFVCDGSCSVNHGG